MYTKSGRIIITQKILIFIDSIYTPDLASSENYANPMLDFFTYRKRPYKSLYSVYQISSIRYTFKRKFLFDHTCVDLIFKNCESLTLNFKSAEDLQKFLKHLVDHHPPSKIFLNGLKKSKVTDKWRRGEISNFFYMMILNYTGSRSYNDLSQYPVLPWFVNQEMMANKEMEIDQIRDFSKNLIM